MSGYVDKRIIHKADVYILRKKYAAIRLKTRRVKQLRSLLSQQVPDRLDEGKKYKYSSVPSHGTQYCFVG